MNRLHSYRMIEGIPQAQLAELLDLSPQMVGMIEGGRRAFTGDLEQIGYGNHRFEVPGMSEPLHRQRASTKSSSRKRAKELLRLAGEVFRDLGARTTGTPRTSLERLPTPTSMDDLEDLAMEVRYALRHEVDGPIRDLTALLERAGVCIVPIVGLDGVDGLSAWVDDIPVIGVAPHVPGDRYRLTLGHELAHLLMHKKTSATCEDEANRFAANLLFPQGAFHEQMMNRVQLRDFIGLKSSWGVSVAALVYRAHDLDYIDDRRYRSLQIQMSKWRRNEPAYFPPVHGQLMNRLVTANGGADTVSSDLGVNRYHLRELVNWSHLRTA